MRVAQDLLERKVEKYLSLRSLTHSGSDMVLCYVTENMYTDFLQYYPYVFSGILMQRFSSDGCVSNRYIHAYTLHMYERKHNLGKCACAMHIN